jgi:hypothetical protein
LSFASPSTSILIRNLACVRIMPIALNRSIIGSLTFLRGSACSSSVTPLFDLLQPGLSMALQSLVHTGTVPIVVAASRFEPISLTLDFAQVGISLFPRIHTCVKFTTFVFGRCQTETSLLILDRVSSNSAVSLHVFTHLGILPLALNGVQLNMPLPFHSFSCLESSILVLDAVCIGTLSPLRVSS